MAHALFELGRAAACPDRFADPAHATIGGQMRVDEIVPRRDDPRGVAPEIFHVDELDALGLAVELAPQQIQAGRRHGHEHGLLRLEPCMQKRDRAREQLVGVGIKERLVLKPTIMACIWHRSSPEVTKSPQ